MIQEVVAVRDAVKHPCDLVLFRFLFRLDVGGDSGAHERGLGAKMKQEFSGQGSSHHGMPLGVFEVRM